MTTLLPHLLEQGPNLRTLLGVALGAVRSRSHGVTPSAPGPESQALVPPRSPALVQDYIRWSGAAADAYAGTVPPHLFPQWGFPLMARALGELPWPMARILNQGCRLEINAPLPLDEPLICRARLLSVQESPEKARITTRLVTGTRDEPSAVIADVHAVVPLKKGRGGKREPALVPANATELRRLPLGPRAGLEFALLTGDFNPVHWLPPYARMAGFKSTILHGFASMALAFEAVVRERLGGDPERLRCIDVRFIRPLLLPGNVGVFVDPEAEGSLFIGKAPGEQAVMLGTFETHEEDAR